MVNLSTVLYLLLFNYSALTHFSPLWLLPSHSLWQIRQFQSTEPHGHSVAVARSHLCALTPWSHSQPRWAPGSSHVRPSGGLRGVHILVPGLQRGSTHPAQHPGGSSVCGRRGQAAAPSASASEGCHRHEVPEIQGSAERPAPPHGTSLYRDNTHPPRQTEYKR